MTGVAMLLLLVVLALLLLLLLLLPVELRRMHDDDSFSYTLFGEDEDTAGGDELVNRGG